MDGGLRDDELLLLSGSIYARNCTALLACTKETLATPIGTFCTVPFDLQRRPSEQRQDYDSNHDQVRTAPPGHTS